MTYQEAQEIVGSGPFNNSYMKMKTAEKRFKTLRESGAFSSSEFHSAESKTTFEELKDWDEPFRSGDTNLFNQLVDNFEKDLEAIERDVVMYFYLAEGHTRSIRNGMDIDTAALAAAQKKEKEVFDSKDPHKEDVTDDKGNVVETIDTTEKDKQEAINQAEAVWKSLCCEWSK